MTHCRRHFSNCRRTGPPLRWIRTGRPSCGNRPPLSPRSARFRRTGPQRGRKLNLQRAVGGLHVGLVLLRGDLNQIIAAGRGSRPEDRSRRAHASSRWLILIKTDLFLPTPTKIAVQMCMFFAGSERINQLLTKAADLNHSVRMMSRPRWMGLRRPHVNHSGCKAVLTSRSLFARSFRSWAGLKK